MGITGRYVMMCAYDMSQRAKGTTMIFLTTALCVSILKTLSKWTCFIKKDSLVTKASCILNTNTSRQHYWLDFRSWFTSN